MSAPHSSGHGADREARVRQIAAQLGVADFVFTCPPVAKGNGANREISGDGLLIVGDAGAILQVKARDPAIASRDSPTRVKSWITKNIAAAQRQAVGTRREIVRRARAGEVMGVVPARALELAEDKRTLYALDLTEQASTWLTIVVIDHQQSGGADYQVDDDTFVITVDDWHELHRRLRSTYWLLQYATRVLRDHVSVRLGHEADRYNALHESDRLTDDGSPSWITELPSPEYTGGEGLGVFRQTLDRVWPDDGVWPWQSAEQYRRIVEFLDRVPAHVQEEIGQKIIGYWKAVVETGAPRSGGILLNRQQFLQLICTTTAHVDMAHHMSNTAAMTLMRHLGLRDTGAGDELQTLGVGMLLDEERGAAYSFAYTSGLPDFPAELRLQTERIYGRFHFARREIVDPDA